MQKKTHYYLVAGEIIYSHPDVEGSIGTIRLNTMLQVDRQIIRHLELGKCQQMLQLHFHNRMKDPLYKVEDVFLYGLSYLGHMTEAEFAIEPAGEQVTPFAPTAIASELN
jgi:hypothetical protein